MKIHSRRGAFFVLTTITLVHLINGFPAGDKGSRDIGLFSRNALSKRYSGSNLQSDVDLSDMCKEDQQIETLYNTLYSAVTQEQPLTMRRLDLDFKGGLDLESVQQVACSIVKTKLLIKTYTQQCNIDRCDTLEKYVHNFINTALDFNRYCGLYNNNVNVEGTISLSSDFSGPFLKPVVPLHWKDYYKGLDDALQQCLPPCDDNDELLSNLKLILDEWYQRSSQCADEAVSSSTDDAVPLTEKILSSREIKLAQNALFIETVVGRFEKDNDLAICTAFYDFAVDLGKPIVQTMTYISSYSDLCDASAEDIEDMPLPELPSAEGLYDIKQLEEARETLCSDESNPDKDFTYLFDQIQIYHRLEITSLKKIFKKVQSNCEAVGDNGGQDAPVGAHSHAVNLRVTPDGQSFCGGTLITKKHVLTAAHCRYNSENKQVQYVSVGGHYSKGQQDDSEEIKVIEWTAHSYDEATHKNDIMILELAHEISKNVVIAKLGDLPEGFEEMGMPVKMAGWGSSSALTTFSDVMQVHALNLLPVTECNAHFNESIDNSFVCSQGNFGSTVCYGDSGSPVHLTSHTAAQTETIVVGLVNFGKPCGLGHPDVFARISYHQEWINRVLSSKSPVSEGRHLTSKFNLWKAPVLNEFMKNDISSLNDGDYIRCIGDLDTQYQYIFGERYPNTNQVSESPTVDCSNILPFGTIIHWCRNGKLGKIKSFFGQYPEVDVNAPVYGKSIMYYAVHHDQINIVKYLVQEKNADVTLDPDLLYKAVYKSPTKELTEYLLTHGANVYVNKRNHNENAPLYPAVKFHDKLETLKLLIQYGANVNQRQMKNRKSLLKIAIEAENLEAAKVLIENGANVNLSNVNLADERCMTPLISAVFDHRLEFVKLLIQNGADVNKPRKDGKTPLQIASLAENLEAAKVLIENGANVNLADKKGMTPLMRAVFDHRLEFVKLLIQNGADVNKPRKDGKTPLQLASMAENLEAAEVLIENGAK